MPRPPDRRRQPVRRTVREADGRVSVRRNTGLARGAVAHLQHRLHVLSLVLGVNPLDDEVLCAKQG